MIIEGVICPICKDFLYPIQKKRIPILQMQFNWN